MNLDELYDVQPNMAVLVGGPLDGTRVAFGRKWPPVWRAPVRAPVGVFLEAGPLAPACHPAYSRTDSVGDDGVRVYRYCGER